MAQEVSRTRFSSSRLVRLLAELVATEVPASRQSFAERLGQWVDFNAALALFPILDAPVEGGTGRPSGSRCGEAAALKEAFVRVRNALRQSIETGSSAGGRARVELPVPDAAATLDDWKDFAPYHRYYLAHQREMASAITTLRNTARTALASASPGLKRLALLDGVLEQAFALRERDLLATVPVLIARRFEQRRDAHVATLAASEVADCAQRWMQPGQWLAEFCQEMRAVLLAELELRLQPAAGLLAALENGHQGSNA